MMRRYDLDSLDNRSEGAMERFAALFERPLWWYFDPVVRGLERVPGGAALYVGNHNAGTLTPDSFIFGIAVYRERGMDFLPYGLGHEVIIGLPGIHQLLMPLGAVRASHANAHKIFAAGKKALVYPGSDYDAMRPYRHRKRVVFGPRRGYVRLALRAGVPVVPVVSAGAHETFYVIDDGRWLARLFRVDRLLRLKVFPLALSVPWGFTVGPAPTHLPLPTRIFIEVLDPIRFDRRGEEAAADAAYVEACHGRVIAAMQSALTRLYAEREASGGRRFL